MRQYDGERILLEQYFRGTGKQLNLTNPKTFSEKMYCRMISWNRGINPVFTQLADKYAARGYVASKVGEKYLVKLLWEGEDPGLIPFHELPQEYVIKTNHACGQVIVVKGDASQTEIVNTLSHWLKTNYYWSGREYQYFHIRPRILIEEYVKNRDDSGPINYKFWCFGGKPEVIHISNYTHAINSFFDTQWNLLDLHYNKNASHPAIPKPIDFEQMMFVASQLSAGIDFVRVDLYDVEGKIYFGELTFTPTGSLTFEPKSWDIKLGEKWKVSFDH